MDSQFTPVHTHLWNHEFRMLVLGCMLLTASVYMQVPVLQWLMPQQEGSSLMAWGYTAFAIGLFLPGLLVSFLVERYRRNWVCLWAIVVYGASVALLGLNHFLPTESQAMAAIILRLTAGAGYGLAQMVLFSTLVTDCCESEQRTTANYATAWMQRIALVVGAAAGSLALLLFKDDLLFCVVCPALAAIVLIFLVSFPFRAPEDASFHLSVDRFLLIEGMRISFHVFLLGVVLGVFFVENCMISFFSMLTIGFFTALIGESIMRRNRIGDFEPMVGMALLLTAMLLYLIQVPEIIKYVIPLMMGCAVGLAAARFQLILINLSPHCRRGTSQSSFWISWESGVIAGIALAYMMKTMCGDQTGTVSIITGTTLTIVSMLVYFIHTRHWYKKHMMR